MCHLRMETYFRIKQSQVAVILFITITLNWINFGNMIFGLKKKIKIQKHHNEDFHKRSRCLFPEGY